MYGKSNTSNEEPDWLPSQACEIAVFSTQLMTFKIGKVMHIYYKLNNLKTQRILFTYLFYGVRL